MDVKIDSISDFIDRHAAAQAELEVSNPQQCLTARLPPYLPTEFHQEVVFSIERDGDVVALAGAMHDDEPGVLLVSYVTVDENNRNRGFGAALVASMVDYMRTNDLGVLETGRYSRMGEEYLKKILRSYANSVQIREGGVIYAPPGRASRP